MCINMSLNKGKKTEKNRDKKKIKRPRVKGQEIKEEKTRD